MLSALFAAAILATGTPAEPQASCPREVWAQSVLPSLAVSPEEPVVENPEDAALNTTLARVGRSADVYRLQVGECYFARGDFKSAAPWYDAIANPAAIEWPKDLARPAFLTSLADQTFHAALAYWKLGNNPKADQWIRAANAANTAHDPNITAVYKKIDAGREDRERAADHEAFVAAVTADNKAFARSYTGDQREIALTRGRPCRITTSDNAYVGHLVIWHYDCVSSVGRETYTFVNGKLKDHTTTEH
jgi:hypothetical protein